MTNAYQKAPLVGEILKKRCTEKRSGRFEEGDCSALVRHGSLSGHPTPHFTKIRTGVRLLSLLIFDVSKL
jgi:hypothetical protein